MTEHTERAQGGVPPQAQGLLFTEDLPELDEQTINGEIFDRTVGKLNLHGMRES